MHQIPPKLRDRCCFHYFQMKFCIKLFMLCCGCRVLHFNQMRNPVLAPPFSVNPSLCLIRTFPRPICRFASMPLLHKRKHKQVFHLTSIEVNESFSTHFSGSWSESFIFPSQKLVDLGPFLFFLCWPLSPSCLSTWVSSRLLCLVLVLFFPVV